MAITVKVSVKDFNISKLNEKLASLPVRVSWAGFQNLDGLRITPFPEASRRVGYGSGVHDDIAVRGELRFESASPLTPAQDASLDSVLAAHNSETLTTEQVRQNLDEADISALRDTELPILEGHVQTWDTKSNVQKFAAMKEAMQIQRKTLRAFIRLSRGGAI